MPDLVPSRVWFLWWKTSLKDDHSGKIHGTTWWRHQMETFSALLAFCEGNSPVTGGFPSQRPVTRSFGVFFYLRLNKRLNKPARRLWFETPSRLWWRHRNEWRGTPTYISHLYPHIRLHIKRHHCFMTWWRHQMEIFSALLAICAGNSPVPDEFPHKGQWRGALMFSLSCVWINGRVNNREAGDLRRYRAHHDDTVMK